MKSHGFFKAANSVSDSLYSGTLAGLVSIVVDDKNGIQSDSIADTISFVKGLRIPYKEAYFEEVYDDVLEGFIISEKLQLPFALVIDASEMDNPSSVSGERSAPPEFEYRRDIAQHVLCPPFCRYQRDVFLRKISGGPWNDDFKACNQASFQSSA